MSWCSRWLSSWPLHPYDSDCESGLPAFYCPKAFHCFFFFLSSFRKELLCGGQGVFLLNVSVIANNDFFDQEGNTIFFFMGYRFLFHRNNIF